MYTARPQDTRPLGGQTLQIRGFELGQKTFEIHVIDQKPWKCMGLHGFLGFNQPHTVDLLDQYALSGKKRCYT